MIHLVSQVPVMADLFFSVLEAFSIFNMVGLLLRKLTKFY